MDFRPITENLLVTLGFINYQQETNNIKGVFTFFGFTVTKENGLFYWSYKDSDPIELKIVSQLIGEYERKRSLDELPHLKLDTISYSDLQFKIGDEVQVPYGELGTIKEINTTTFDAFPYKVELYDTDVKLTKNKAGDLASYKRHSLKPLPKEMWLSNIK